MSVAPEAVIAVSALTVGCWTITWFIVILFCRTQEYCDFWWLQCPTLSLYNGTKHRNIHGNRKPFNALLMFSRLYLLSFYLFFKEITEFGFVAIPIWEILENARPLILDWGGSSPKQHCQWKLKTWSIGLVFPVDQKN